MGSFMLTIDHMAKNKPTDSTSKPDRHKVNRMARVRERLAVQLDLVAAERDTDFTEEVNRAVREMLEREGKWPPKS